MTFAATAAVLSTVGAAGATAPPTQRPAAGGGVRVRPVRARQRHRGLPRPAGPRGRRRHNRLSARRHDRRERGGGGGPGGMPAHPRRSRPSKHRPKRFHAGRCHTEWIDSRRRVGVGQDRARRRLRVRRWQRVRLLGAPGRSDQGGVLPRRRRRLYRRHDVRLHRHQRRVGFLQLEHLGRGSEVPGGGILDFDRA